MLGLGFSVRVTCDGSCGGRDHCATVARALQ